MTKKHTYMIPEGLDIKLLVKNYPSSNFKIKMDEALYIIECIGRRTAQGISDSNPEEMDEEIGYDLQEYLKWLVRVGVLDYKISSDKKWAISIKYRFTKAYDKRLVPYVYNFKEHVEELAGNYFKQHKGKSFPDAHLLDALSISESDNLSLP
jgi:hypothetical protein